MAATTIPQQCAYPGCDQPTAAPGSDRGAKPKYCDDPDHNPLAAHRERRRRQAEDSGQRAEESGGQPVRSASRAPLNSSAPWKSSRLSAPTPSPALSPSCAQSETSNQPKPRCTPPAPAPTSALPRPRPGLPKRSSAAGTPTPSATPHAPTVNRPTMPPPRPSAAWKT